MLNVSVTGDLDFIRQAINSLQEQQRCRQKDLDAFFMQQKRLSEDVDVLKDCITDVDITTNQINSKLDHMTNIRPGDIDITTPSSCTIPISSRLQSGSNLPAAPDSGQFPQRPAYVRRRAAACSLINSDIEEES